ncbi:MAG: hypothetical protein H0X24_21860 [Ktedonobacterales bacterium]|nr:hypothetical protein [Ktedonobacterales bacterium]
MQPESTSPNQPSIAIGALDGDISDEEANAEIDIPEARPAPPRASSAPAAKPPEGEDTTPSVRKAVDKAAEILRELRDSE